MGGPRLDYFALRPMNVGGTSYAVGDVVDVTAMTNDTVTGLVRSGWLATTLKGDIRSAVVQAAEPTSPQANDLWVDSDAVSWQAVQVTTGSVAAGATADVTVTWPTAYPDATYVVVASVLEGTAGDTMEVLKLVSQATTDAVVRVINNSGGALTGTVHALAMPAT